jgi:phage terminase small subunit
MGARGSGGHGRGGPAKQEAQRGLQDTTADCAAPEGMSAAALEYWHYFAPLQVKRGLLTESSRLVLRNYCQLLVECDRVQAELAESKPLIFSTTVDGAGNEHPKVQANPLIGLRLRLQAQLHTLENDLCLNPATALRLPAVAEPEVDPLDEWATGTTGRRMKAVK